MITFFLRHCPARGVCCSRSLGNASPIAGWRYWISKSGQSKVLVGNGGQAEYLESGHLAYVVDGTLWAVRFDLTTLEVDGEAVPVVERALSPNFASFSVSRQGGLAYVPALNDTEHSLVWVDRDGRQLPLGAPPRRYRLRACHRTERAW